MSAAGRPKPVRGTLLPGARTPAGVVHQLAMEHLGMTARVGVRAPDDGVVQAAEVLTQSVGRNVREILRQVHAFQHARATGEVTPCDWPPEGATLKPGSDLAGRVFETWRPAEGP